MKNFGFLTALAFGFTLVSANTPLDGSVFTNDPMTAILAAAPFWHFDEKTCFPTSATQAGGAQTVALAADFCSIDGALNQGCPVQAARTRQEQTSTSFPTYYTIRQCSDNSWRIVYDVYFQKDTGHPNDWEWVAVKFVQNSAGQYVRDGIFLEQDGNHPYTTWGSIPHTFDGDADIYQYSNINRDHPKAFFGKWKHNVGLNFNDEYANNCPGALVAKADYHSDDYAYYAGDNLLPASTVPANYDYGSADSTPSTFGVGGKYDVCNL